MRTFARAAAIACGIIMIAGCANTTVKKGDRFKVAEDLRVEATIEWEQPISDGFTTLIPKGTIVEARFTTTPGAAFFECMPVKVNGSENAVTIIEYFVPDRARSREGFKGFSFNLRVKDIGTKLIKQ